MEIGSEFYLEYNVKKIYNVQNNKNMIFVLSGRTAIDYALQMLESRKKLHTVYFPSYCCESMLAPFKERNINIEFYNVKEENGILNFEIDINKSCDIFFAMNYFGFSKYNMDMYIEEFKKRGIYVIEDSTHSLLSSRVYNENSDFVIASLRKWFPIICGGICICNSMKLEKMDLKPNEEYVKIKKRAMIEKNNYIIQDAINKEQKNIFLKNFSIANEMLNVNYKNYGIDIESYNILRNLNILEIVKKRKENSKIIYEYLEKQVEIEYLKNIDFENDCPIFIPVFLKKERRNELKEHLINNEVYCPTHWEIPKLITDIEKIQIYDKELSLICDQRYNKEQIKKYIGLIKTRS